MKKQLSNQFWRYVLPSMIAMLLSGFYAIVDGLFVGNAIGSEALGAINIAYPIQVILNASAVGIGIGGAICVSCAKGEEEASTMYQYLGNTLFLLGTMGILFPFILFILHKPLLHILGASGSLFEGAQAYLVVILIGGILPVLSNGINPLLRNQEKPLQATLCMCMGLITNIILDYIFVFQWHWGLFGAGLATIIAQGIVALSSLSLLIYFQIRFMQKQDFMPSLSKIKDIVHAGISPFGQTLVPCIVIILTNWIALHYGGNEAVTIYSIVTYVLSSAQLLLQGIGDGVQPLFSFYHGANKEEEIHYLYHKAFFLSISFAIFLCVTLFLFVEPLTLLFGIEETLMESSKIALLITFLSFPALATTRLTSALFYATRKANHSSLLVYLEPCMILPFFLIIFSSAFGLNGIWAAYPIAQFTMSKIALILKSPNITTQTFPLFSKAN